MSDCQNCPYLDRIKALEKGLESNKSDHKKFFDRFEAQIANQAVTNERYETIIKTLDQITTKVEILSDSRGKKWDTLTNSLIEGIAGLVLGIIIASLAIG